MTRITEHTVLCSDHDIEAICLSLSEAGVQASSVIYLNATELQSLFAQVQHCCMFLSQTSHMLFLL